MGLKGSGCNHNCYHLFTTPMYSHCMKLSICFSSFNYHNFFKIATIIIVYYTIL